MSDNHDLRHHLVEDSPSLPADGPLVSGLLVLFSLSFIMLVALFCLGEGSGILKQISATVVCIFIAQEFLPPSTIESGTK